MKKALNIDTALLDAAIDQSGLRIAYIVDILGISRQAFDQKRKGKTAFRQSEVYCLCSLLNLDKEAGKKIFYPEC